MAGQVGAKFCLVVNLVPHNRVRLPRGAGRADGEDQAAVPRRYQQLQDLVAQKKLELFCNTTKKRFSNPRDVLLQRAADLPALLVVWEVAVTREASRTELLAGVRVLVGLWEDTDNKQRQQNTNVAAPSLTIAASLLTGKQQKPPQDEFSTLTELLCRLQTAKKHMTVNATLLC